MYLPDPAGSYSLWNGCRLAACITLTWLLLLSAPAFAVQLGHYITATGVDWTSAGVGGLGEPGSGEIQISDIPAGATVQSAYLFWHGIDFGGDDVEPDTYDEASVSLNGLAVNGVSLGDTNTNCWPEDQLIGTSRGYRANVSSIVTGNGVYLISGTTDGDQGLARHNANGASLVVIYDDGDPANDRDLAFFAGNDANRSMGYSGEDDGWISNTAPSCTRAERSSRNCMWPTVRPAPKRG